MDSSHGPGAAVAMAISSGLALPVAISSRAQRKASTTSACGSADIHAVAAVGAPAGSSEGSPVRLVTSPRAATRPRQTGAIQAICSKATGPNRSAARRTREMAAAARSGGVRTPDPRRALTLRSIRARSDTRGAGAIEPRSTPADHSRSKVRTKARTVPGRLCSGVSSANPPSASALASAGSSSSR